MINALGKIKQVGYSELVANLKLRDGVGLSDEVGTLKGCSEQRLVGGGWEAVSPADFLG